MIYKGKSWKLTRVPKLFHTLVYYSLIFTLECRKHKTQTVFLYEEVVDKRVINVSWKEHIIFTVFSIVHSKISSIKCIHAFQNSKRPQSVWCATGRENTVETYESQVDEKIQRPYPEPHFDQTLYISKSTPVTTMGLR